MPGQYQFVALIKYLGCKWESCPSYLYLLL
jgi:hypothetical protein